MENVSDINLTKLIENITLVSDEDGVFPNHDILMNSLTPSLVFMTILFIFGLPGNLSVLFIYSFRYNESTTRIFILALAFLDTINCAMVMPFEIVLLVHFDNFDYPALCKLSRFTSSFINNSSAFILIAIAIDRFKRICKPHGNLIETTMAKKLVISAWIFSVLTSWQMIFLYGTRTLEHGKTCLISDHMYQTIFPVIFIYVLVVGQIITDGFLVILYTLVGREVCRRKTLRRRRRSQVASVDFSHMRASVDWSQMRASTDWSQVRTSVDFSDEQTPSPTAGFTERFSFILRRDPSNENKPIPRNNQYSRKISQESRGKNFRRKLLSKTTIMMFMVTVAFVLSFVPHTIAVIIRYQAKEYIHSFTTSGMTSYQLFLRSYFLNSVLNPFIYCFVSKQFRTQFKESVMCCRCKGSGE